MQISRRGFLKYCIGSAAALGLPLSVVGKLEEALGAVTDGLPKVVWLAGANCTGSRGWAGTASPITRTRPMTATREGIARGIRA